MPPPHRLYTAAFGEANKLTMHVNAVHKKRGDFAWPHYTAAFGTAGYHARHMRSQHSDNTQGNEIPL